MIVHETADVRQARARLWNLMLGGSQAYENEWQLLRKLKASVPQVELLARNERDVITRFWHLVAGAREIEQVVHIGAPLPAGLPPHRRLAEPGRVVYVEGDELLYRTGKAWMSDNHVDVVQADPLDVPAVIDAIGGRIDWFEPVAVIAPHVLSWVDDARARTWIEQVAGELPAKSMLATTHLFDPQLPDSAMPIERLLIHLNSEAGATYFRRRADLDVLFSGLTLADPGVTPAVDWWPNGPRLLRRELVDELLAMAVVVVGAP